jgi:transcriptional regulator with XRE-family HTH domain
MNATYAQLVGQVVRGSRELKGMDLATMAASASLSLSSWSRVETGHTIMTVSQLRRAARSLRVEPWTLVKQADSLATQLSRGGIVVIDDKPADPAAAVLGGAALLALLAGGAAIASKMAKDAK